MPYNACGPSPKNNEVNRNVMGIMRIYYTVIDLFIVFTEISIAIDTVSRAKQTIIYSYIIHGMYFNII